MCSSSYSWLIWLKIACLKQKLYSNILQPLPTSLILFYSPVMALLLLKVYVYMEDKLDEDIFEEITDYCRTGNGSMSENSLSHTRATINVQKCQPHTRAKLQCPGASSWMHSNIEWLQEHDTSEWQDGAPTSLTILYTSPGHRLSTTGYVK